MNPEMVNHYPAHPAPLQPEQNTPESKQHVTSNETTITWTLLLIPSAESKVGRVHNG